MWMYVGVHAFVHIAKSVCASISESKREERPNEETGADAQRFKQCQGKKIRIEVTIRTAQYIKQMNGHVGVSQRSKRVVVFEPAQLHTCFVSL